MDARTLILKLAVALASIAKAPGTADGDMGAPPGGEGAPPPTAEASGGPAQVIGDALERLTALSSKVTDAGLPDGSDSELKTIAGMLLTLTPGGMQMNLDGAADGQGTMKMWVTKALAPEVELSATVNFVCDRMWGINDLLRKGDIAGAKASIGKVLEILNTVGSPEPAAAEGGDMAAKSVKFENPEVFAQWSLAQLTATKSDAPEACVKRLANLQKAVAIAKLAWEQTGAEPKPIDVEMESCFAGLPGTPEDLTTKTDQETTQAAAGAVQDNTGNPSGGTNIASNGLNQGNQDTMKTLGDAVAAIVRDFTANNKPQPGTPSAARSDGADALSKRAPAGGEFQWPGDMADFPRDADGARIRTTKMDNAPPPPAKVTKSVAVGSGQDDSWGKDPWAQR